MKKLLLASAIAALTASAFAAEHQNEYKNFSEVDKNQDGMLNIEEATTAFPDINFEDTNEDSVLSISEADNAIPGLNLLAALRDEGQNRGSQSDAAGRNDRSQSQQQNQSPAGNQPSNTQSTDSNQQTGQQQNQPPAGNQQSNAQSPASDQQRSQQRDPQSSDSDSDSDSQSNPGRSNQATASNTDQGNMERDGDSPVQAREYQLITAHLRDHSNMDKESTGAADQNSADRQNTTPQADTPDN